MIKTLFFPLMICLASCLHAGDFLPKYVPEDGNCYQYAFKVYYSSPHPDQGVYECGDTVFVVVVLDTKNIGVHHLNATPTKKSRLAQGKAMLRSIELLRERMPDLPAKFTIQSRLVERSYDDNTKIYRYAIAFCKSALHDAITLAKEHEMKSRELAKMKQDVDKERIEDNTSSQEGSAISGKEKKAPVDAMPSSDVKQKEGEKPKNVEEAKVGSSQEGSAISEKKAPVDAMPPSDVKQKEEEKPKNVE